MAPALVEHSAARERYSISKGSRAHCWFKIDLELYNLVRSLKTRTLPLFKRSSCFLEMNDSGSKDKQDNSFAENENDDMVSFKDLPIIAFPNLKSITLDSKPYNNGAFSYNFDKSSINVIGNTESSCIFSTKALSIQKDSKALVNTPRLPTPTVSDNAGVISYLQKKKKACEMKFTDLSKSIDRLHHRLRVLQSKNVFAHVSTHVMTFNHNEKPTDECFNGKDSRVDVEKSWEDLRKLRDMICLRGNSTDSDEDFDVRHDWHNNLNRKKKKTDETPPPIEALHKWKGRRASIGSQCSWLSMKISALDEKVTKLDQLRKAQKRNAKKSDSCIDDKMHQSSEEAVDDETCRRVLPVTDLPEHKYVKTEHSTQNPADLCGCLPAVSPCHQCLRFRRQYPTNSRYERTSRFDGGFHSRLSGKSEVSLSFLLEEALRKQRIDTRVNLSKPMRKKKKQKMMASAGNNELSERLPPASKKSLVERGCTRSRVERQKYDELSRKRSGLESSAHGGRSRKSRKLSESEESWKPSTPTELNSPFSQNLSSSAFFPLKRKKNSSGTSYDINNIVIPYSMAASTRVERIQYKEIPTPGWRSVNRNCCGLGGSDEYETTDDEAYTERHLRCEIDEKRKFADCYRHTVVRRRPNHLSESTASGPPSPLVSDELRPVAPSTPVDSPLTVAALLTNRLTNLVLVPGEERDSGWSLRSYPLNPADCAKLSIVTTSSVNTPIDWKTTNNTDTITTNMHFASATMSTYSTYSKYFESTTNNTPLISISPHRTYQHSTAEETLTLPTPLYTPVDTPMPSPLSPDCETLLNGDGTALEPTSWTVKERPSESVTVDTRPV